MARGDHKLMYRNSNRTSKEMRLSDNMIKVCSKNLVLSNTKG